MAECRSAAAQVAAIDAALDVVRDEPARRRRLQQLAALVHKYGKTETKMLGEILRVLGMDPDLEQAETQTNDMRETLQSILAGIEELMVDERDRFKTLEGMFQQHLDISREAAAAMQTVADALKASE